ncbi:MAG: DUF4156 domain-containing protein [Deltaproteobacteria bacterium]|nr:DUF4156 domain-containing protein [Deltaproteobacteria bacterium]
MKTFLILAMIPLLGLGGIVQLAEASEDDVLMATERDKVDGCKYLGKVTGSSSLGGIAAQKWGQANAEKELRKKTDKMGGNVVLVHSSRGGFYGAEAVGDAYLCIAEARETGAKETPPPEMPASGPGGCTKDTDCKGDRICESGKCVNP